MAHAYQQICVGEELWVALGNFRNAWYGYAKDHRSALVNEPLMEQEHSTIYIRHWGAFCAASVEFLCDRYGVPCPEWATIENRVTIFPIAHLCYTRVAFYRESSFGCVFCAI